MSDDPTAPPGDPPEPRPDPAAAEELRDAERQAASFTETRKAHQSELVEDYAELIADLIDATGEARMVDLARRLGVTHATVGKMLARMQREGLVASRPYRSIFLTDRGRDLARAARRRHQIVVGFLKAIGVDAVTAEVDAEGIEHHVSAQTLAAFERLLEARRAEDPPFDPIA